MEREKPLATIGDEELERAIANMRIRRNGKDGKRSSRFTMCLWKSGEAG
jgi:hypothetical protein